MSSHDPRDCESWAEEDGNICCCEVCDPHGLHPDEECRELSPDEQEADGNARMFRYKGPFPEPMQEPSEFEVVAREVGELTTQKNSAYGDAVRKTEEILRIMYPDGVPSYKIGDMLLLVRILDKMIRISCGDPAAFDESPYRDIAGYGVLGAAIDADRPKQLNIRFDHDELWVDLEPPLAGRMRITPMLPEQAVPMPGQIDHGNSPPDSGLLGGCGPPTRRTSD